MTILYMHIKYYRPTFIIPVIWPLLLINSGIQDSFEVEYFLHELSELAVFMLDSYLHVCQYNSFFYTMS